MTLDIPLARALCDAATAGPWRDWGTTHDPKVFTLNGLLVADLPSYNDMHDAAFIAAARTLLPAALDEVERLTLALSGEVPSATHWHALYDKARAERDTALASAAEKQATIEALVRACLNLTQLLPDKMHDEGSPGLAAFFAGDDHSAAALLAALGEVP